MRLFALALACFLAMPGLALAESRIASAVHDVEPILHEWGYVAVAGAAALDFVGVPVPAVTILVAATLAATRGDLGLPMVFAMAVIGMIAGSQLGYGLGRWGGRVLLRRVPAAAGRVQLVERHHARFGLWLQLPGAVPRRRAPAQRLRRRDAGHALASFHGCERHRGADLGRGVGRRNDSGRGTRGRGPGAGPFEPALAPRRSRSRRRGAAAVGVSPACGRRRRTERDDRLGRGWWALQGLNLR